MINKRERRNVQVVMEVRAVEEGSKPPKIIGHASVFDQEANIGGWFIETVRKGAFTKTIKADDIRALFNHDPNFVLGRNRAGTLSLAEDAQGLAIEIDTPDTALVRDMVVSPIQRGDVTQMSIGFCVIEFSSRVEKDQDLWYRDLLELQLFDVSPVTFPAFEGTDVSCRSAEDIDKEFRRGPEEPPVLAPPSEVWKHATAERRRRIELAEL